MFKSLLKVEFSKHKRSCLHLITFLTPLFSCLLLFLDFALRKPSILANAPKIFETNKQWQILLCENFLCNAWIIILPCVLIVMVCLSHQIESSNNNWKLTLSRPVKKHQLLSVKFIFNIICATIIITLNIIGVFIIGKIFNVGGDIEIMSVLLYLTAQLTSSYAIISLQHFLSYLFQNEITSILIGFAGILGGVMLSQEKIGRMIIPYCYMFSIVPNSQSNILIQYIITSIFCTFICLILSYTIFNRKDVR